MDTKKITLFTDVLTAQLRPANRATAPQLNLLKKELPTILSSQPVEETIPFGFSSLDRINLQTALEKIGKEILSPEKNETTAKEPAVTAPAYRAVRREVPAVTSQYAGSTPLWAAGMAVDHTLGPFIDNTGKWYWWDFYNVVQNVMVQRGTDQFLMIPVRGILTAQQQFELQAGSIWIRSQLIASSAPAGAYTGLKIKGGTLSFDRPVTISGGNTIVISGGDECHINLILDQPEADIATDNGTGGDAKKLTIQLPQQVSIQFNSSAAVILSAGEMKQQVYGNDFYFTYLTSAAFFEPLLNRILVSFQNQTANNFSISNHQSKIFFAAGNAEIKNNFWALPVTLTAISQLGEAAGIGAIVLELKQEITAAWNGLEKTSLQLNECFLLTEPGRIAFTANN